MIRVLVVGGYDPVLEEECLAALTRWNGRVELAVGRELKGVDLVLALPGGNGEAEARRARAAGLRVAEAVGCPPNT